MKYLATAYCLFFSLVSYSQTYISFGGEAGVYLVKNTPYKIYTYSSARGGYNLSGNLGVKHFIKDKFSIDGSVNCLNRRSKDTYSANTSGGVIRNGVIIFNYNYINLPLNVSFYTKSGLNFKLGGYFSYLFYETFKLKSDYPYMLFRPSPSNYDFGSKLGLGYMFHLSEKSLLEISLNQYLGFKKQFNTPSNTLYFNTYSFGVNFLYDLKSKKE